MKRLLGIFAAMLLLAGGVVFTTPAPANAVELVPDCQGALCDANKAKSDSIVGKNGIVTKGVRAFSYVAAVVAVIFVALAGIRLTTSQGDPGAIKQGRETIIYAIVGVVVAVFCQAIVIFVLVRLEG